MRHWIPVVLLLAAGPAAAQERAPGPEVNPPGPRSGEAVTPMTPPETLPRVRADRGRDLNFLFEALKIAPDEASAKHIEGRIWAQWLASGSDTANLLMARAKTATDAKDIELAIKLLDSIVEIRPQFVEAWNRRATLHYLNKDYERAMADIRQVLLREPRHFGALSGLGMILHEFGDEKRALEALRRAAAIHPHLSRVPDLIKSLGEKVDGRDI